MIIIALRWQYKEVPLKQYAMGKMGLLLYLYINLY